LRVSPNANVNDEESDAVAARNQLLKIRKTQKRGKPRFARQESWRYKRVRASWRKPRGKDSKMRRKVSGRPRSVEAGYSSPKAIRGVHPSGFREVLVHNLMDLEAITSGEAVRVAHTVGLRKKLAILQKADELSLRVLNPVGVGDSEFEEPEETGL